MKTAILVLCFCCVPVFAAATLYSCRDNEGRLHITDNLQTLPDECRFEARELEERDPDNLHFVPERTPTPAIDIRSRFEQEVREQQERQRDQERREADMVQEARELVALFQQAQLERREAIRRWSADSRRAIEQAGVDMDTARSGKQRLLAELERRRVSIRTSEQVRAILEQIQDS